MKQLIVKEYVTDSWIALNFWARNASLSLKCVPITSINVSHKEQTNSARKTECFITFRSEVFDND